MDYGYKTKSKVTFWGRIPCTYTNLLRYITLWDVDYSEEKLRKKL